MSDIFELPHLALQDTLDLFKTGYSVYQDQRNYKFSQQQFDYQKALQKQIFEREDNAVQRRRADLEAAGMNPNLAAGSAAGAGSVVATGGNAGSQAIYSGDLLGNYVAYQQALAQKKQNEILETEKDIAHEKKREYERINTAEQLTAIFNSGAWPQYYFISPYGDKIYNNHSKQFEVFERDGIQFLIAKDNNGKKLACPRIDQTNQWQMLKAGYDIRKNDAFFSNYDADHYSLDRNLKRVEEGLSTVSDVVGDVLHGTSSIRNASTNEKRAASYEQDVLNRRQKGFVEDYTRTRRGYKKSRRYN